MIRLLTLGRVRIEPMPADAPKGVTEGVPLALLVYLAHHSATSFDRERLADRFWPDVDLDAGLHSLRQALSSLRKVVGPDVLPRRQTSIKLGAEIEVDTDAFRRAARELDGVRMVELYAGDFLAGFEVASPDFNVWVEQQRDGLRATLTRGLIDAGQAELESGPELRTLHWLRRGAELLPLEPSIRTLALRVALKLGVPDAVEEAHAVHRLYEELEIPVPAGTQRLVDAALSKVSDSPTKSGERAAPAAHRLDSREDRRSAHRATLDAGRLALETGAYDSARTLLAMAVANAPDLDSSQAAERILARAPPSPAPTGAEVPAAHSRRRVGITAAAAVIVVASVGLALALTPSQPPALGSGWLVYEDAADRTGIGIIYDPAPGADVEPLADGQITIMGDAGPNPLASWLPSPSGALAANAVTRPETSSDVFVWRRDGAQERALAVGPGDDSPLTWMPDEGAMIVKSGRPESDLWVHGLDDSARQRVTDSDGIEESATVHPHGTWIAFYRSGRIFRVRPDGSDEALIADVVGTAFRLAWSPDGQVIAGVLRNEAGTSLFGLRPDTGDQWLIADNPSSDSRIAWRPDGSGVLYTGDSGTGNEVYEATPDTSVYERITYTEGGSTILIGFVGPAPPYVDAIRVTAGQASRRAMLPGDTLRFSSNVRDSGGEQRPDIELRWTCEGAVACDPHGGGEVWAVSVGAGSVTAGVPGWRETKVEMEVADPKPLLVLAEEWEGPIDETIWQRYGIPDVEERDGIGQDGSGGLLLLGDSLRDSGVVTKQAFSVARGLTIAFYGYVDMRPSGRNWQALRVGIGSIDLGDLDRDEDQPPFLPNIEITDEGDDQRPRLASGGLMQHPGDVWDPSTMHEYTLQVRPSGEIEAWLGVQLLWRGTIDAVVPDSVHVAVGGKATHALSVVDNLRVYEGLLRR